jgi:hypothetical protein
MKKGDTKKFYMHFFPGDEDVFNLRAKGIFMYKAYSTGFYYYDYEKKEVHYGETIRSSVCFPSLKIAFACIDHKMLLVEKFNFFKKDFI